MPFNPPQQNDLLPLLLQHTLNQRAREEARSFAIEEERKERRRSEQNQLFELAMRPDLKLDAFAPLFEEIGPEDFRAAQELQKAQKKRQQETTQAQAFASPESVGNLSALLARRANLGTGALETSPTEAQGGEALQQAILRIGQSNPELLAPFMEQVGQAKTLAEQGQVEQVKAQQFQRGQARADLGEQRAFARGQELLDATAQGIAEEMAAGTFAGSDAWAAKLSQEAGIPRHRADKLASEAMFRARGVAKTIARQEQGAQGKRADVIAMNAEVEALMEQFPEANRAKVERDVSRMLNGTAIRDPLGEDLIGRPVFLSVSGQKEAGEVRERRRAIMETREQFFALRDSFEDLRFKVESGEVSAGALRTTSYFDALNLLGAQPAEVAAYRTNATIFAASLLKAMQGSRPSEFDFKMYLAMPPTLTEIAAGSADAKLDQLDNMIRIQALSESDPAARKAVKQSMRPDTPADQRARSRVRSLSAQMDKALEMGDTAEQERIAGELFKLSEEWRSDPGATVPNPIQSQPLSPAERLLFEGP